MKLFSILPAALALAVFALAQAPARAQEQKSPEQQEKEMYEAIDKQIEKLTATLDLDMAQEFYVDSILTHNYFGMMEELMEKSNAKVSNSDIYVAIQDKWSERTYVAFEKIFTEEQWVKYLKSGAARDKKARDKREAKRTSK